MRIVCLIFVVLTATIYTFAQDGNKTKSPEVNIGNFRLQTPLRQPTTSVCAIPLIEAQVPKNLQFAMPVVPPPTDKVMSMPQAKAPAPSCSANWSVSLPAMLGQFSPAPPTAPAR